MEKENDSQEEKANDSASEKDSSEGENNSSIEVYFQLGSIVPHAGAFLDLLEVILGEKFFDELRTK